MRLSSFGARTASVLCIATLFACSAAEKKPEPPAEPMVPMPARSDVPMALAANYAMMSLQFKMGDASGYSRHFVDTARIDAPGAATIRGRDLIALKFGAEGTRLGIEDFKRQSLGVRVDGRDVTDSGTYEFVTKRAVLPHTFGAKGRYWTRWHFSNNAEWSIISDSIVGDR